MARKDNFLLGNGERLTGSIDVPKGGGDKNPPYPFMEARDRISSRALAVVERVTELPADACPGDEVVLSVTMHPRYISKSDFPNTLLRSLGLRAVGSRAKKVTPEKWGIEKHPTEAIGEEIFAAGRKDSVLQLRRIVEAFSSTSAAADDLSHIEDLAYPSADAKLKNISKTKRDEARWLEVVLHNRSDVDVFSAFTKFAERLRASVNVQRRRDVGGLTFVPVSANVGAANQLANFSFLRVARSMPTLRPLNPTVLRLSAGATVNLPTTDSVTDSCRALILDGGLPSSARTSLQRWVNFIDAPSVGLRHSDLEAHGLAVTSAFLFGPIFDPNDLQRPICGVDHVRVLDSNVLSSADPYYFDVLDRILAYFDSHGHDYALINISIGPNLPTDDDDVTLWTAALDSRLASGEWVVTVAAGNDGDLDPTDGLNRIQPPADAVNVLTVGAADSSSAIWSRASYSCPGPGRSPGFVKPDGLIFGGTQREPFPVLSSNGGISNIQGTSVASPFALRSSSTVKAQLGNSLNALAIRALMIHRATPSNGLPLSETGWGRFEDDPQKLITCEDHEVLVIYQGELPIGEHLRTPIPLPKTVRGKVHIEATLVISTDVDPSHASAYTRSGLEVFFRPHADKYTTNPDGTISFHPKTSSFFSPSNMYGVTEYLMRENGHKWEPCIRGGVTKIPKSLKAPCFDIYNHRRADGVATASTTKTKYALVVTVSAKRVRDLYGQVVRAYSHVLIPLRPRVRIEVPR